MAQLPTLALAALLASGSVASRGVRSVRQGLVTQAEARSAVCLRFVGPWARQRASRLQADLETTFRRRSVSFGCGIQRVTGGATSPSYQLSLTVDDAAMPEVTLAVSETTKPEDRRALHLERYVDLRTVPVDGRNLALVVAADELLDAARRGRPSRPSDEAGPPTTAAPRSPAEPPATPAQSPAPVARSPQPTAPTGGDNRAPALAEQSPPLPIAPSPATATRRPPTSEQRVPRPSPAATSGAASMVSAAAGGAHQEAALSVAMERYKGGQTHIGPELAWSYGRARGVFAVLAVGARKGLVAQAMGGVIESSLWTGRLALGGGVPVWGDRLGVAIEVGARLGQLHLQGRANGPGVTARDATPWLCYADATATLRVRIVGRVQARLAAGVGLPLLGQRALEGAQVVTAASGAAALGQVGAMVVF